MRRLLHLRYLSGVYRRALAGAVARDFGRRDGHARSRFRSETKFPSVVPAHLRRGAGRTEDNDRTAVVERKAPRGRRDERMRKSQDAKPSVAFNHQSADVMTNPYPLYKEMRGKCPVAHTEALGGYWVVADYDTIKAVERNYKTFSNSEG